MPQEETNAIDFDQLELTVVPNFLNINELNLLHNWIETMMPKSYQDFDDRVGICWDDFWLTYDNGLPSVTVDPIAKYVTINHVDVQQFPESIFSYKETADLFLTTILRKYREIISKKISLPSHIYIQSFVLRSLITSKMNQKQQLVRWHRDPSDYPDTTFGDYTLVLMLSDPQQPDTGWQGGNVLIKSGQPNSKNTAIKVNHAYGQAIIFNNKNNSHAVTKIICNQATTRDIMIVNMYLTDPSIIDQGL